MAVITRPVDQSTVYCPVLVVGVDAANVRSTAPPLCDRSVDSADMPPLPSIQQGVLQPL